MLLCATWCDLRLVNMHLWESYFSKEHRWRLSAHLVVSLANFALYVEKKTPHKVSLAECTLI